MDAIKNDGKYTWDGVTNPSMKFVLRDMMWKGLITRKTDPCLYANVFIGTIYLLPLILNNEVAQILNKK